MGRKDDLWWVMVCIVSIPQAVWDHMWRIPLLACISANCVSIPQAVWDHMWRRESYPTYQKNEQVSIPQAVWDHMWLLKFYLAKDWYMKVSIPQAVWDHMWHRDKVRLQRDRRVSIPQAVWDHMWRRSPRGVLRMQGCFNTASGMRSHVT